MSSADWEEVKKLAADFQRAQLTSVSQRLTERNCIEIVNKLIELKLLDVVFTSDGKEYITPDQISREIQNELYANGGRMSLIDLAHCVNVSINVIEDRVKDLVKGEKTIYFILGQLLNTYYLDNLCEELNEKLYQEGVISISELSKTADLPGDFLQEQIERRVGRVIQGKQDETDRSIIYTEAFVRRNTSKIRGVMSAITKPVPINQILIKFGSQVPEKLFFQIVDKLISSKRIEGILSGGSGNRSSYFIPSIYSRAQSQWVDGFMNGNGYVDLDAASRLGISDPKSFITKRFSNQKLVFLKTCCLGESLFNQLKESVEESLESPGWIDIGSIIPMSVTEDDIKLLLDQMSSSFGDSVVFESTVVNRKLIANLRSVFKPIMEERAQKDINSGKYVQLMNEIRMSEKKAKIAELNASEDGRGSKKEERRKRATGGKGGGGTQGRETKTKSTKKKYMAGKKDDGFSDSDDDNKKVVEKTGPGSKNPGKLEFLKINEISRYLQKADILSDAPNELFENLSSYISNSLSDDYQSILKEAFDVFMSEKCGRKNQEEILEKLTKMLSQFQLYTKGLGHFEGDTLNQLEKYILRIYASEITSLSTTLVLMEAGLDDNSNANDLPNGRVKESLLNISKANTVSSFKETIEFIVPQKKSTKDKLSNSVSMILVENRENLLKEMEAGESGKDPALFLLATSLLLFSIVTDTLLFASGKFVPQIISFLANKIDKDEHSLIKSFQDKVIQMIKLKNGPGSEDVLEEIKISYPLLKNLVKKKMKDQPISLS